MTYIYIISKSIFYFANTLLSNIILILQCVSGFNYIVISVLYQCIVLGITLRIIIESEN